MNKTFKTGFTLVEIMVAVSIFVIVAVIATGAFITANNINRQAQAMKLVMDNLNFALDSMSLKIRKGGDFECTNTPNNSPTGSKTNCPNGGTFLYFSTLPSFTSPPEPSKHFVYRLKGSVIEYNEWTGNNFSPSNYSPITMEAAEIEELKFYVYGSSEDTKRGLVAIVVRGKVKVGGQESAFALQTAVSQR